MKPFEKIMKRPTLPNYYRQRHFQWPDTLPEIFDYLRQHDERPFLYGGDNWPYDAMCEWQRRQGVSISQFLTPDLTARQMAALAVRSFDNECRIVDACCGTGQLTRVLIVEGVHPASIVAFDADTEHGGHLLPALSRGDRDAESVSGDRFPLRERHRQPAVRDGGVYGVPALAG